MKRWLPPLAAWLVFTGCASNPPRVSVSASAVPSPPLAGCQAARPPGEVPWSSQHPDGIDARWIGTVDGTPAELSVFDAQMKADQGLSLVGLYICSAR